jgi:hypothetical protein
VPQVANVATSAQTFLSLHGPGNNAIVMLEEKGQLYSRVTLGGTYQNLGSVLYSAQLHAWWRIRESGGTLLWETAPDGKTWTIQQQLSTLPFAIDVLDVEIGSETYKPEANPGAAHFDNCNLPPP